MRRFLSTWLVLIVIGAFSLAILVAAPVLSRDAAQAATADLNELLDASEALLATAAADAEAVSAGAKSNILSKTRAVSRFLAHDDGLLQTDALVSMCELLEVAAVDVTDYAGNVVASSVAGRIGRNLTDEPGTAWTGEVLDGEGLERAVADESEPALLWGCVLRSDTEGFVLVQTLDRAILTAQTLVDPQTVLRGLSFVQDSLEIAETPGSDGAYEANDRLYVRRTHAGEGDANALSLLASRSLGSVYMARNVALLVLSLAMLVCILLALLVQLYLRGGARRLRKAPRKRSTKALTALELPAQDVPDGENAASPAPMLGELPAQDVPDDENAASPAPMLGEPPAQDVPDDGDAFADAAHGETVGRPAKRRADKPPRVKEKRKKATRAKLFEFVPVEPGENDMPAPELPAQDVPDDENAASPAPMLGEPPAQDVPDGEDAFAGGEAPHGETPLLYIANEPPVLDGEAPLDDSHADDAPDRKPGKKPKRRSRKQRAADEAQALADSVFEKIID